MKRINEYLGYKSLTSKQWHELHRASHKWTDNSGKSRLIKDLSDSHLLHIIGCLQSHPEIDDHLKHMLDEARYRYEENIFVPDYPSRMTLTIDDLELSYTVTSNTSGN